MCLEGLEDRRLLESNPLGDGPLETTDRFEPNDTRAAAANLGVVPGVHLTPLKMTAHDEDWYRVEVLRPGSIDVSLGYVVHESNLLLEVTDRAGTVLATGESTPTGPKASLSNLDAGTYYIHVASEAEDPVLYSLAIDPGPASTTRVFYVNDGSTADDYYTSAVGNDANDGLTPSTPKATLQSLLAHYDLDPTDLVLIDTGTYGGTTVTIAVADEGAAYAGSPAGSAFNYSGTRWELNGADGNLVYGLRFAGSYGTGIRVHPLGGDPSSQNVIRGNEFPGCDTAIHVDGGAGNLLCDNVISGSGSYGVYLSGTASINVSANDVSGRGTGIYGTNSAVASVQNNEIRSTGTGISWASGTLSAIGNDIHHSTTGLASSTSSITCTGNHIHHNGTGLAGYGVLGPGDWSQGENDIHDNTIGVRAYDHAVVQFNRIYRNAVGIQADSYTTLHHNLLYRNTGQGVLVNNRHDVSILSNTIYTPSGDCVRIENSSSNVSLRNNILWTEAGYDLYVSTSSQQGFASDFNNLFTSGTGVLVWWQKPFTDLFDWQVESDYDSHSIGYTALDPERDNPRFVDLADNDYHLTYLTHPISTSIDAGDPTSSYALEPGVNGARIDLGAYGNTAEAAQSRRQYIEVDYPNFYVDWPDTEGRTVLWHTYDFDAPDHLLAGLVSIDLYQDGVGLVANLGQAAASAGALGCVLPSGIQPNSNYRVRIAAVANPSVWDESREPFNVPIAGNEYFVNDASQANDEYCSAVGNNRNSGRTAADPKANLLPLLRSYDLGPNDVVKIDTGSYIHVRNVIISGAFGLGDDEGATFTGPTDPAKIARIDRANTNYGSTTIELNQADYVTLRNLTLTGARTGLWGHNSSTHLHAEGLVLSDNADDGLSFESSCDAAQLDRLSVFNNRGDGIYITASGAALTNSTVFNNQGTGIYVSGSNATVSGNVVYDNNGTGVFVGEYTSNVMVSGNVVYDNQVGISAYSATVRSNRVYHNSQTGIVAYGSSTLEGNVVYSNAVGILGQYYYSYPYHYYSGRIANNLVYANTERGIVVQGGDGVELVNNCLLYTSPSPRDS